ncbi:CaiB/BaiF CoA transferase family protein [Rhodococcus koreensis]
MALPLAGVRVLDFSMVIAGPYASAILRGLGAEVIKVEPLGGDPMRQWVSPKGAQIFAMLNAGKKSVAANLRSPEAVAALKRLLPTVDVVLQNSRAGQMDALGLSAAECTAVNPRLVYVAVTGFGSVGPWANRPAYDSVAQSFVGLLPLLTQGQEHPTVGPAIADIVTGLVSAQGVLAGLLGRDANGGEAQVVETSLVESVAALIPDTFVDQQTSGHQPNWTARQARSQIFVLSGSDGGSLVLHISTSERFFQNLCKVLGRTDLMNNPQFDTYAKRWESYAELRDELQAAFKLRPRDEWERELSTGDVPYSPLHQLAEVREHPQVKALGMFASPDPETSVELPMLPWRINSARPPRSPEVPHLGEHSLEILSAVLTDDEMTDLLDSGAIRGV